MTTTMKERARGCMMGQFVGDALGAMVEFKTPQDIRKLYPDGNVLMEDGGTWDTLAGQVTDDSEMALMLARSIVNEGIYDMPAVRKAYLEWYLSNPFDIGNQTERGLIKNSNTSAESNGALMRVSPLGIYSAGQEDWKGIARAVQDAEITHPVAMCRQANAVMVLALRYIIENDIDAWAAYDAILSDVNKHKISDAVYMALDAAQRERPADYIVNQGWVLTAFQNAFYQLLYAENFTDGLQDTIIQGGDTDTNAAIAGSLLGAYHGIDDIPSEWQTKVLNCAPDKNNDNVVYPRPEFLWPNDILQLADKLLEMKK